MKEQMVQYEGRFKSSEGKIAEIFTTKGRSGSFEQIYGVDSLKDFRGNFGHSSGYNNSPKDFISFISNRNFSFGAIKKEVFEKYKSSYEPVGKTLKFIFVNLIEKNK